jgi:hypothetical protein
VDSVRSNLFSDLHAEVVAEKLVVFWTPDAAAPTGSVVVHASAADLAHWPTRDWRSYPMTRIDMRWQTALPVEDPDVPLVYFVAAAGSGVTNGSATRGVLPRAAGLEEPTRPFWPFLEGFEQGCDSWRVVSGGSRSASLRTNSAARTGNFALSVTIPAGQRSVTVATTRLRGWQARAEDATGLRVWLKTREGTGRARCSLLANAGATNQSIAPWPNDLTLTDRWRKLELSFNALPGLPLGAVDLFAIEFIADGPREFLIDDLQLLGPWKTDVE